MCFEELKFGEEEKSEKGRKNKKYFFCINIHRKPQTKLVDGRFCTFCTFSVELGLSWGWGGCVCEWVGGWVYECEGCVCVVVCVCKCEWVGGWLCEGGGVCARARVCVCMCVCVFHDLRVRLESPSSLETLKCLYGW